MNLIYRISTKLYLIFSVILLLTVNKGYSQNCEATVPRYIADLTGNPDSVWTLSGVNKSGQCCGNTKKTERYILFVLTLDTGAAGVKFSIIGGATPTGSAGYQINCGPRVTIDELVCLNTTGPHYVTFFKPGNDENTYRITSIARPTVSPPTYVSEGCTGRLEANSFEPGSVTWTSTSPGARGAYNHYLSCTNCTHPTVTAQEGYPPYVDYEVSGIPGGGCSGQRVTLTVRVHFVTTKTATILPYDPAICFGGINTTLTANGTGGAPPYNYLWSTGETTQSISSGIGTYWVTITDQTNCPPVYDTVTVIANPSPITANAGPDVSSCANNTTVALSGTIVQAAGGIWTGGAGTYSPSNTTLNATYTPTANEVTAGTVRHILTTTGNGGCPEVRDTVRHTIMPIPFVNAGPNQSVCANNPGTTLAGSVTGSTTTGIWSGGEGTFFPNNTTLNATYTPSTTEITNGTVTLTLTTTNSGSCNPVSATMTITITTAPIVNAGVDRTVCANNNNVTLAGSVTGPTTTGQWIGGTGTFNPSRTALNATYTPSAAEITAGTVSLTLSSTNNNNCNPVTDAMVITITPPPVVNAGIDRSVCANNVSLALNGSVTGPTTTGEWIGGTGTFNPGRTALNATYTPSATEITAGTVSLTLSSTNNNNCSPVTDAMVITITPAPIVIAGPGQSVCANNTTVALAGSVTGPTTTGIWSGGTGTFSPNNTALNATYTPSATEITAGTVSLTLSSTNNNNCSPVTDAMVITITPAPIVTAGPGQSVCANNTTVALAGSVTGPTTTGIWSGGTGTFSPNNTTVNANYTPSAAEITAGSVTLTLTSTNNNNCSAASASMTITITTAPVVNAGVDRTVCANNNNVTLAGSVTGPTTTGQWIGGTGTFNPSRTALNATYTPSATEITAGTVSLTLSSTNNNNCNPVTDAMVITITPAPIVNAGTDQTVCANNVSTLLSGSVTGPTTAGVWSGGTGTFNPGSSTLNATYTPNATEITAGSVTLTLTSTFGNCSPVSDAMLITITTAPTANAGIDRSICSNNPSLSLSGAVTIATGGTWSGGAGNFSPNANTLNATYTPTPAEITAGSLTLTLTTTGNGNCIAATDNMVVTFTTSPTVNAGADQTICANNATATLNGMVTVATGGIWSGGGGTFNPSNTALNATYTPSATEIANGSVNLTLTTTGMGSCLPVTDQVLITITPAPIVNAGLDLSICANNPRANLNANITNATGGTWTGGTGTFNPNNTTLNAIYTPSAAEITAGTVTLTLTSTGHGNCLPVNDQILITITPPPTVNAGTDRTICANNATTVLNGSVTIATGGAWSGGSGSFIPNNATLNATYLPSPTEIGAGIATLVLTTTGNGSCFAVTDTMQITIAPPPFVNAGPDQNICLNNLTINLNGMVSNASASSWTGGAGTFSPSNTSLNASYTPTATELSAGRTTLILTGSRNTCNNVTDSVVIRYTPIPTVDAGPDQTVCANNAGVSLNGAVTIATGGVWSGGTGTFSPNATTLNASYTPTADEITAGTVNLTLTTTGMGNCNAVTDQIRITITPAPVVNAGTDRSVCFNNATLALNGTVTIASGGTWTGGAGSFIANPSTLNATYVPTDAEKISGSVNLTLTSTGNGNCLPVTDNMLITITPAPTINAGPDQSICSNNPNINLSATKTVATSIIWTGGNGTYSPSATDTITVYQPTPTEILNGSLTLTATTTSQGNCLAVADNITITFTPSPTVSAGPDQTVCAGSASVPLNGTVTVATSGTWATSGTGTFSPSSAGLNISYNPSATDRITGNVTLTLTTTGMGNCNAEMDQMSIAFTPVPTVNAGPDKTVCTNDLPIQLEGSGSPATWSGGLGTYNPNSSSLNATYTPTAGEITAGFVNLTLTTTPSGACPSISDQVRINIPPGPIVNAGADQTLCADRNSVSLNGAITNATAGVWTTLGTGSFTSSTSAITSYLPSASDKTVGSAILILTSAGISPCSPVSDTVIINFTPPVTANAGPNQTYCADIASIDLNGVVTVATGGTWTTSGTGTFANANSLVTTYIPSSADTAAMTVTLTLTSTGNGLCNPVTSIKTITFTPAPTVNAGADQTICADAPSINLSGAVTVATGGVWTTTGTGAFSPNPNTLSTSYFPTSADTAAGLIRLTLTTAGNGTCNPVSDFMELRITPVPVVNAGSDRTMCADAISISLNASVITATGGTWVTSGSGTFSPNANTVNAVYTMSPADKTGGIVTLTLTSTGNGTCNAYSDQTVLSITPAPTVNAGPDIAICGDAPSVPLSGTVSVATGGSWTTAGSGTFNAPNSLSPNYLPSDADRTSGSVRLILTTTGNGTCNPVSDTLVLTITPIPTANAGTDQTLCSDVTSVNLNGGVTIASGGAWTTTGAGTFAPNATTLNAVYVPVAADSNTTVTFTLTTTGNGTCNPVSDQMAVIFTPAPRVNAGPDQTLCANNATIQLNGSILVATGSTWTGGTGTFTPDANILNATYQPSASEIAARSIVLTLTTTGNGTCNPVEDFVSFTITPAPELSTGGDRSVCTNNPSVQLSGSVTVASGGRWEGGSGIFSPDNQSLNAIYTPSADEITAGSTTLNFISTGNGNCLPDTAELLITITPPPTVNAGPDQSVCSNNANIQLAGAVTVATGGIWSGGNGTFAPSATDLNAVYQPTPTEITSGSISLTLTTSGNGTCNPVTDNLIVTFTPPPFITTISDTNVCGNNAALNLGGTVQVATGGTWSGGNGTFSPDANTPNAIYTPSQDEITAGGAVLTLTTTGNGNCLAETRRVNITITPSPIVNAGPDRIICANNATFQLNGSVSVATGGTWSGGTGTFSPDANTLNAAYTPSADEITAGTVTLRLSSTGNGRCNIVSDDVTFTITPAPTVDAGNYGPVCGNNPNINLNGLVTIASGGNWSGGTGILSPNASTLNAAYTPSITEINAGSVTLTLTTTGNGNCNAVSSTVTIPITPAPTADAGLDQDICADATGFTMGGIVTVATGGTWTTSGTGTFSDANTLDATYVPSATDTSNGGVTLTLTTTGNGNCTAVSDLMVLTITPAPTINAGLDRNICADLSSVSLSGAVSVATGAVWTTSGSGSFIPDTNTLNANYAPSAADTAARSVILTLTSIGNGKCNAVSDQMTVNIAPVPVVNPGTDQTVCADVTGISLNGRVLNAGGGLWTSTGTGIFSPNANTLNGTYVLTDNDRATGNVGLTLTSTGNASCNAVSRSINIIITPAPTIDAGPDVTVCADNPTVTLRGAVTVATGAVWSTSSGTGTFSDINALNSSFTPSFLQISNGRANLTLTSTGNGTCQPVTERVVIFINPIPVVSPGPNQTVCITSNSVTINGSVQFATGGSWTTSGTGTFANVNSPATTYVPSAVDKAAGTITLTLTSTGNGPCNPVSRNMILRFAPAPTVDAGPATICSDNTGIQLNATVTVASGVLWTTSGSGTYSNSNNILNPQYLPSAADVTAGSINLIVTSTGNGPCAAARDTIRLGVVPAPTANAGNDQITCANAAAVTLNGSVNGATGGVWSSNGGGTFSPNTNTLNATYTPSAIDISNGSATLTLTTTGVGICSPAADQMVLTITPAPTSIPGSGLTVCADTASIQLNGTVTIATGGTWTSSGGGSFLPTANTLNARYIPSAADISNGQATLTLTTTGNGQCSPVASQMIVNITPAPTINLGSDQIVCGDAPGYGFVANYTTATGVQWSYLGAGSISPSNTSTNIVYNIATADTNSTISLIATTTGNGMCKAVKDTVALSITIPPSVSIEGGNICGDSDTIRINGRITIATGGSWTTSGTGRFFPDSTALNVKYVPSATDKTNASVTLTLTTTGNGICNEVSESRVINIIPAPTALAGADQTVCADISGVALNGTINNAGGGLWTSRGSGVFSNNTSFNPNYVPSAADTAARSVTLILTTTGNGTCNEDSDSLVVTINPAPVVDAGPAIVCMNNPTLSLSGFVSNAGGAIWTTSGSGTFGSIDTDLNNTYTLSPADLAAASVTLTLTSTGNGLCNAVSDFITVNVTTAPRADAGPDLPVCSDYTNVAISGSVTNADGGEWYSLGTGTFSNATSLSTNYQPSTADKTAGAVRLVLRTTGNGLCSPVTDTMVVSFTPAPTLDAGPGSVCSNNATMSLSATSTVATAWLWTSSGTGSFTNATSLNATYTPSVTDRSNGSVTLTISTTAQGDCQPISDNITIFITPAPQSNAGSDQTVCADTAGVRLSGSVVGVTTGGWTTRGTGTFSPDTSSLNAAYIPSAADISSGLVKLFLTTTNNGNCRAVSDSMEIAITPAPTINAGSDQTACADITNVNLNGMVTVATGGIWTTRGNGTFGSANSLITTYQPSQEEKTAGFARLALTSTNQGSCKAIVDSLIVTITPAPTVDAGPASLCSDNSSVQLNGVVTIANGGIWTTSGTGSFSPNANTLNAYYIPSSNDRTTGSVVLTLTTTGNGTCIPVSDNITLNIAPPPTANAGGSREVCSNTGPISLSGTVTNATGGAWTSSGNGTFANSNSLTTTYTPSTEDINNGFVDITLSTTGMEPCIPASHTITITLTPAPVAIVNAGADQTVCEDNPDIQLNGQVSVATGGEWSSSGSGFFTPNAFTLDAEYLPDTNDINAGSVELVLTTTGNGTCIPVTDTLVLTIQPSPVVDPGLDQIICADAPGATLNGSVTYAPGLKWYTSGSGNFLPNDSAENTTYVPSELDKTDSVIIITLSSRGSGICSDLSSFKTLYLTINPAPIADAGFDQTVCADNPIINLSGKVTHAGGGTWTSTGTGTFTPHVDSLNTQYIPSDADTAAGRISIVLQTRDHLGCQTVSDTMAFIITDAPTIDAGADTSVCADIVSLPIEGRASMSGGLEWSSSGTGTFAPDRFSASATYIPTESDKSSGSVNLTLSSASTGSCQPLSDTKIVVFTPAPTVNAGSDVTVCGNNAGVTLNGVITTALGGIWNGGNGIFSTDNTDLTAVYTPSASEIQNGSVQLTLVTTDNGKCNAIQDRILISITPAPTINAGSDQTVCSNNASIQLNGAVTIATGGVWRGGNGTFVPDTTGLNGTYTPSANEITAGSVNLTLVSTGNGSCTAVTDAMTLTINPGPAVNAGLDETICADRTTVNLAGSIQRATGATWSTTGTGAFSPDPVTLTVSYVPSAADTAARSVTFTLSTDASNGCLSESDQMVLTITPAPIINAGPDEVVCGNNSSVSLNGSVANAIGGAWTGGTGTFAPDRNTLQITYAPSADEIAAGSVILTLTSSGQGTCNAVSDLVRINISETPEISAGPDVTVCANNPNVRLNGTVQVSRGAAWSGGTGTFAPDANSLATTYTPSPAEITAGRAELILTSVDNGTCLEVKDTMVITITPAPTVNAGSDVIVCSDKNSISLAGNVTISTGGNWSGGLGSFAPNASALSATYSPSAGDKVAGTVSLILTTSGSGNCLEVTDTMQIRFTPAPTAIAGSDLIVCGNNSEVTLNGQITVAGGGEWLGGRGTFGTSNTDLNTTYRPSAEEITAGTVTLTLRSTDNGDCNAVEDYMAIQITPAPTADAGPDQTVCGNNANVTLNGIVGVATGGAWTGGTGSFNPSRNVLNATYTPSAAEITDGAAVSLVLNTTGNGTCLQVRDTMNITITPIPTVSTGNNVQVCANNADVVLRGAVTIATGGIWSTDGSGTFAPNTTALTGTYIPSEADKNVGRIGLTLTSTGHGNCLAVRRTVIVTITPAPTITAGRDTSTCSDATEIPLQGAVTVAGGVRWTSSGTGTFSPNATTAKAVYMPSEDDIRAKIVNLLIASESNLRCRAVTDTMRISFTPAPTANAGIDQTICADAGNIDLRGLVTVATGGEWATNGSGNFANNRNLITGYVPSNADTTARRVAFFLKTTGNGTCRPVSDTIEYSINPTPVVNTGAGQICVNVNDPIPLNGVVANARGGRWTTQGTGTFAPNAFTLNASYYPSEADKANGMVKLTLTSEDMGTCNPVSSDVNAIITPLPVADAGQDQIICRGTEAVLNGRNFEGLTLRWLSMRNDTISHTSVARVRAFNDTTFVLEVQDLKGCKTRDEVLVKVADPPTFNLADHYCFARGMQIDANPTASLLGGTYQWYRNDTIRFGDTLTTHRPAYAARYKISHFIGSCITSDTTNVTQPPVLNGRDKLVCIGRETDISTTNYLKATYTWFDTLGRLIPNSNNDSLKVRSTNIPRDTVSYVVEVRDSLACTNRDTINVITFPPPILSLENPTLACKGDVAVLDAKPVNIEITGVEKITWYLNNKKLEDTTIRIYTTQPGIYAIHYNIGECGTEDTTELRFLDPPITSVNDTAKFCMDFGEKAELDAGPGHAYEWQINREDKNSKKIEVEIPGYYHVKVYDGYNCFSMDSIYVKNTCPPRMFVPNAFRPSTEGKDKYFKIFGDHFTNFNVTVFNRWGEIIFSSQDPKFEWDGNFLGEGMPEGVYPFIITYGAEYPEFNEGQKMIKGSITILR